MINDFEARVNAHDLILANYLIAFFHLFDRPKRKKYTYTYFFKTVMNIVGINNARFYLFDVALNFVQ